MLAGSALNGSTLFIFIFSANSRKIITAAIRNHIVDAFLVVLPASLIFILPSNA